MDAKLAVRKKADREATAWAVSDEPLFRGQCRSQPRRRSTLFDPIIDGRWQPASQIDRGGKIFGEQPPDLVRSLRNSAEFIDEDDCAVTVLKQPLQKEQHVREPPTKFGVSIRLGQVRPN